MKRGRTKEKMENNTNCSQKKHNETHLFRFIPQELIVEILLRVPPRSIAKFVFVSKLWSSIISGKGFTKLYLTRWSNRPRILFVVYTYYKEMQMQFLQSCSQEDPSSDHHKVHITPHPTNYYGFSPPVHGLICRQKDTMVMIGNPSTGQFVTLPNIKSKRKVLFSFFGYDPVNDVYKVLCMTKTLSSGVVSDEHQVFTLGAKQNWRRIECNYPHWPHRFTKELCINGVVYYYARIERYFISEGYLISFDLISEEFNVIPIPEDIKDLVNYNGKIALMSQRSDALDLWVLEDASKEEWSRVSLLVPSWTDLVGSEHHNFRFRGTLSTGEFVFAPRFSTKPFYFISFDLNKNNAKKVVVEGIGDNLPMLEVYFDHVESPMVLPFIQDLG